MTKRPDPDERLRALTERANASVSDEELVASDMEHMTGVAVHPEYDQGTGPEWAGNAPTLRELLHDARATFRHWYRDELDCGARYDHRSRYIPPDLRHNVGVRIQMIAYDVTAGLAEDDLLMLALSAKPGLLTNRPDVNWSAVEGLPERLSVLETIELNIYWCIVQELRDLRVVLQDEHRLGQQRAGAPAED